MGMQYARHDDTTRRDFTLKTSIGTIDFQFPPKVQSDTRSGAWNETEVRGIEPIAVFKTTSPRGFTILITYIVDGNIWSADKITTQLKNLRGYYINTKNTADHDWLVAWVKMWKIGGPTEMTCRLKSTNVKYSDTLVGDGQNAFPLRTDVTIDLQLWTKGGAEPLQNIKKLDDEILPEWY